MFWHVRKKAGTIGPKEAWNVRLQSLVFAKKRALPVGEEL